MSMMAVHYSDLNDHSEEVTVDHVNLSLWVSDMLLIARNIINPPGYSGNISLFPVVATSKAVCHLPAKVKDLLLKIAQYVTIFYSMLNSFSVSTHGHIVSFSSVLQQYIFITQYEKIAVKQYFMLSIWCWNN